MENQDHFDLLLQKLIEEERKDASFVAADAKILQKLLTEVNQYAGTRFTTLTELASYNVHGAGPIVARYIEIFQSEGIRMELLDQLVADRVENCGQLLMRMYRNYRRTWKDEMEHLQDACAYDNAFWRLKPKRMKAELFELTSDIRSVVVLPFTMRMLASWKLPEMKRFLLNCLEGKKLGYRDFGMSESANTRILELAKAQVVYVGLYGLRYYPSAEVLEELQRFEDNDDKNIRAAAIKTMAYIAKHKKV